MKFSVVIPLFNKAGLVEQAVASALAQTLPPLEVIVVDDGSTDGGGQALLRQTDPRLRVICQANAGVSAARNRGIEAAQGDWVAFLDADDAYHPQFLEALAQAHARCPQADLIATRFMAIDQAQVGRSMPDWPAHPQADVVEVIEDLRLRWMKDQSLCSSSAAVRRSRLLMMEPRFVEGECYGEDLDMWFRLSDHALVALVDAPYSLVRAQTPGSLTSGVHRQFPPFLQRMQAQARDGTLPASHRASALWLVAQLQVTLAREALEAGRHLEALRWLARGRHAMATPRWLLTLLMAFLPGRLTARWQQWRTRTHTRAGAVPPARTEKTACPQEPVS